MTTATMALVGGAVLGAAAGAALIPLTLRQLAASVVRATAGTDSLSRTGSATAQPVPRIAAWHRLALVGVSGLLPALVFAFIGWSPVMVPPLLLVLGLVQLAYCDATRRLLPKFLVYGIGLTELVAGLAIACDLHQWQRFWHASFGAGAFFAVLLIMNLLNPRWMAFGDVRLAPVVGFGLTWISPTALIDGFFIANILAAAIGIGLMVAGSANRKTQLPFGFYLAIGTAITILAWS